MTYVVIMDFTGKFSYPLANKEKGYFETKSEAQDDVIKQLRAHSDRLGSWSDEELLVTFAACYMIVPVTSK